MCIVARVEVSVAEAADLLGLSPRRVRALAESGRIPARQVGGVWLVDPAGLHGVQRSRRSLSPAMSQGLVAAISAAATAAPVMASIVTALSGTASAALGPALSVLQSAVPAGLNRAWDGTEQAAIASLAQAWDGTERVAVTAPQAAVAGVGQAWNSGERVLFETKQEAVDYARQVIVVAAQQSATKVTSEASTPDAQRLAWNRLRNRMVHLARAADGDADSNPADLVRSWLAAQMPPVRTYLISPSDLPDLAADPRVVMTGISDPRAGLAVVGQVEARVTRHDLNALVTEFWLREDPDGPVRLLITDEPTPDPVPLGVLVEDLAAHPGPRESEAVARLLGEHVPWLLAMAAVPPRAALARADWQTWTVQPEKSS